MKNKILKYVEALIVVLAFASIAMMFLPAVKWGEDSYNGLKVIFGYTQVNSADLGWLGTLTNETGIFSFSFINLLTYILVLLVAVLAVVAIMKGNKKVLLGVALFAIVAGVFFLLTNNFIVLHEDITKLLDAAKKTYDGKLAVGPIVGACCMFVSAIAAVAKYVLDK